MTVPNQSHEYSSLLAALVSCRNTYVVQYALRLVNALAAECSGRAYLLRHPMLVEQMVAVLKKEREDTRTRQNALGVLTKLSLRRRPVLTMIKEDLIKWICDILNAHCDLTESGTVDGPQMLSSYSLEHATALLMHLSLPRAGKISGEDEEVRLLEVRDMLHSELVLATQASSLIRSLLRLLSCVVLEIRSAKSLYLLQTSMSDRALTALFSLFCQGKF